ATSVCDYPISHIINFTTNERCSIILKTKFCKHLIRLSTLIVGDSPRTLSYASTAAASASIASFSVQIEYVPINLRCKFPFSCGMHTGEYTSLTGPFDGSISTLHKYSL